MQINKTFFHAIFIGLLLLYSNALPQDSLISNIRRQDINDTIYISYTFNGNSEKDYNIQLCIKDHLFPNFTFTPKLVRGTNGIQKVKNIRNFIAFHRDELPDELSEKGKLYFEITANEIKHPSKYNDYMKLGEIIKPDLDSGVAVILGVDQPLSENTYMKNSAEIFRHFCYRIMGIKNTRYEYNSTATKDAFETIFKIDGWLHNNIQDGISDVFFYFAGKYIIDKKNNDILLLPYGAAKEEDGYSLSKMLQYSDAFNPSSMTVFIEGSILENGNTGKMESSYFELNNCRKIKVIMAGRGHQDNIIYEDEKIGLFTYHLLTGLAGAANVNDDDNITLNELYEYVKISVWDTSIKKDQKEQDPILFPAMELTNKNSEKVFLHIK